jgi:hypothetical protein
MTLNNKEIKRKIEVLTANYDLEKSDYGFNIGENKEGTP